jgi:hypothetical protein
MQRVCHHELIQIDWQSLGTMESSPWAVSWEIQLSKKAKLQKKTDPAYSICIILYSTVSYKISNSCFGQNHWCQRLKSRKLSEAQNCIYVKQHLNRLPRQTQKNSWPALQSVELVWRCLSVGFSVAGLSKTTNLINLKPKATETQWQATNWTYSHRWVIGSFINGAPMLVLVV